MYVCMNYFGQKHLLNVSNMLGLIQQADLQIYSNTTQNMAECKAFEFEGGSQRADIH